MRVKQEGSAKCAIYTQLNPYSVGSILDAHFAAPQEPPPQTNPQQPTAAQAAEACCPDCNTSSL